jgi:hypothetical protein
MLNVYVDRLRSPSSTLLETILKNKKKILREDIAVNQKYPLLDLF